MRTVLLLVLLVAGCHHDDSKGERDRKRSTDTVTHDTPATTPAVVPALAAPEDTTVYRVPIGKSPAIGGKAALVTIVEFADFQCPYCKRADATLAPLRAKYGDDVRLVWKNLPMTNHARAKPAAELAMDAYDQHQDFWAVHDDLFAAQTNLDDAALARIATAHSVKQSNKHHAAIDDDQTLARSLGLDATPAFFINGRKIMGAQGADAFTRLIDAQLADAKARVAGGSAREKVYDEIMATSQ